MGCVTLPDDIVSEDGVFTVAPSDTGWQVLLPSGELLDTYRDRGIADSYVEYMNGHLETARKASEALRVATTCPECGRVFDLTDETDAAKWSYGHDCEEES